MFARKWLTKISYVRETRKIIPFIIVGATAMRVVGNKEGNGKGSKGDGDGNKGVIRGTAIATKWAMATVTRVAGKEKEQWWQG
jgi:hypothetical protein